jgi:hypothetical protein
MVRQGNKKGHMRVSSNEYVLVELHTSHCFLMEFKRFIRSGGKVKIEPHHTVITFIELRERKGNETILSESVQW